MAHDIFTWRQCRWDRDDPFSSLDTVEKLRWPLGISVKIEGQLIDLHPDIPLVALECGAVVVGALCKVASSVEEGSR